MQDFLMLSSFALWAAVLGLTPVLAFHLLMGARVSGSTARSSLTCGSTCVQMQAKSRPGF